MSDAIPRAQVEPNSPFQGQELDFCEPGVTEEGGIYGRDEGNYFRNRVVLSGLSPLISIFTLSIEAKKMVKIPQRHTTFLAARSWPAARP